MKKLGLVFTLVGITTLTASATVFFTETFSYPDGPLTTVSAGIWTNTSGTAGQLDVMSGRANLTENESEDVAAGFGVGALSTGTIYYSLMVNFSAVPFGTAGGYFAHLKPSGTFFRARLFAAPGSGTNTIRLGISNGGNTPVIMANDLSLNLSYQAVVRYDLGAALATLWVNPLSEVDPSVTGADSVTAEPMLGFSLRQSRTTSVGMGTLTVDDIVVASTFAEVLTIPEPAGLLPLGLLALLAARKFGRRS